MIRSFIMALFMTVVAHQAADAAVKIQTVTSPKGITAWLVEEHSVPVIAMEFAFRGGATQAPANKAGLATMMASLLDEGAGSLASEEFQTKIEEHAIELGFEAQRDSFNGSLRTLSEKKNEAVALLKLAVTKPRFDAEPVERIRTQLLTRLRRDATDPQSIASRAWAQRAFPDHPYGQPSYGTEQTLGGLSRDDLTAIHAKNFARDNLVVAVVGDIDAAALAPMLDEIFGDLPEKSDLIEVPAIEPQGQGKTLVIEQNIPQTTVLFSRPSIARHDPDYMAAVVMNHILGGGTFTSRLFNEVREKRGLAYSVYSYIAPLAQSSLFGGALATRNDRAKEAVALIEAEIDRFVKEGPTEEELEKSKLYLMGSYPLSFDSSSKISRGLRELQLQGMPTDYITTRNDLVKSVSREDVMRVAKRILGDGSLLVVAAGKPEGIEQRDDAVVEKAP